MNKYLITLGLLLTGLPCYALDASTEEDLLHGAAHFGATYVITHTTEVTCKKVIGKEHKLACTLAGITLANAVNIARKAKQGYPSDTKRAVVSGLAGSLAAGLVISIDW